jgi:hypothetical protein
MIARAERSDAHAAKLGEAKTERWARRFVPLPTLRLFKSGGPKLTAIWIRSAQETLFHKRIVFLLTFPQYHPLGLRWIYDYV